MHAFDRRTDRQTDGQTDRILIARPRLHSMQRGKNEMRRVLNAWNKLQDYSHSISGLVVLFYDVLTYLVFFCTHLQFICVLSFLPFLCSAWSLLLLQGKIVYYFTDMSRLHERHYRKQIGVKTCCKYKNCAKINSELSTIHLTFASPERFPRRF